MRDLLATQGARLGGEHSAAPEVKQARGQSGRRVAAASASG
jgi:hypothetical protein